MFISIALILAVVQCASSSQDQPERNLFILGPVNATIPGYRPVSNQMETKEAARYLRIQYWKKPPSNYNDDDPHGAVFRVPEDRIYFNISPGSHKNAERRRSIFRMIEAPGSNHWRPSTGADIPYLMRETGLLFHGFGLQQGQRRHPWVFPDIVLDHWANKSDGLYQQSVSYIKGNTRGKSMVATPVGILLDPQNPEVFTHLMGTKELYYLEAVRKFPIESPRRDQICAGRQGLLEASRAQYNAYNWRYVSYINGCYLGSITSNSRDEVDTMKKEDGVKFFLGSPLDHYKHAFTINQIFQRLSEVPANLFKRSRKNFECQDCLWNEAIISAPVDAILGVILWTDDVDTPVSRFAREHPRNKAGLWFTNACRALKRINPTAGCYQAINGYVREVPDGIPVNNGHQGEPYFPKGIAGQAPEIIDTVSHISVSGLNTISGFDLSTLSFILFAIFVLFLNYGYEDAESAEMLLKHREFNEP